MSLRTHLLPLSMLLFTYHASPQSAAVSGHVTDNAQHSVPNVQVRLRPPVNSQVPELIAPTDGAGAFTFQTVPSGAYLLEVSQGPYVLYRQKLNVPTPSLNLVVQRK